MLEKDLERYLVTLCKKYNLVCIKGNPRGVKGYPDRIVFGDNIYFIELKLGKENGSYYGLTEMQNKWQAVISQTGAVCFCLTNKKEIETTIRMIAKYSHVKGIINPFGYDTAIKFPAQEEEKR